MRQHLPLVATDLPSVASLVCVAIALILIKAYDSSAIGFGFLIIVFLLTVAANVVIDALRELHRKKVRADIQRTLAGETMCDFLRRNPDRLRELQSWGQGRQIALLEALDAEDARCMKEFLPKGIGSEKGRPTMTREQQPTLDIPKITESVVSSMTIALTGLALETCVLYGLALILGGTESRWFPIIGFLAISLTVPIMVKATTEDGLRELKRYRTFEIALLVVTVVRDSLSAIVLFPLVLYGISLVGDNAVVEGWPRLWEILRQVIFEYEGGPHGN